MMLEVLARIIREINKYFHLQMILLHTQEIVKTLPSAREMVQLLREFVGHYWTGIQSLMTRSSAS